MQVKLELNSIHGLFNAEAVYDGETFTVKAGGRVDNHFSNSIKGGKKSLKYRNNQEFVSKDGTILKDCTFTSPSTAAQFVSGKSLNGWLVWKEVNTRKLLSDYRNKF